MKTIKTFLIIILTCLCAVLCRAQSNTCANGDLLVVNNTGSKNNQCITPGTQPAGTGTTMVVANDTVTGTTVNKFAKLTGAPSKAIISSNGDTENAIGVVTSGAGTTGNATITILGQVSCIFDGATTAGNYVTIAATGGGCHDAGSSYPTSGATYGRVLSTNGGAGTYVMELMTPDIAFQNAGNGKSKPGTPANSYQFNSSNQFAGGVLTQPSANTVEQVNSTNAQTFNLYKTFTSVSSFQRLRITSASGQYQFVSENNAGAGSDDLAWYKGSVFFRYNGTDISPSTANNVTLGNANRWGDTIANSFDASAASFYRWTGRAELYSPVDGMLQISGNGANKGAGVELIIGDTSSTGGTRLQRVIGATALRLRAGDNADFAYLVDSGRSFVSTQFDKTNATLANVTGLTTNVTAGKTYAFEAELFIDADVTGGGKYAIAGTATATAIKYEIETICDATNLLVITSRQTALAGSAGQAGCTAGLTRISGTITVNAAGTLTVQFAQNTANGTSSVLTMSKFEVRQLN